MRRFLSVSSLILIVNLMAVPSSVAQNLEVGAFSQAGVDVESENESLPIPGSASFTTSADFGLTFASATLNANATASSLTASGTANSATVAPFVDWAEATSSLSFDFGLAATTQVIYSYSLVSPAVGVVPDPSYSIRQTSVDFTGLDDNFTYFGETLFDGGILQTASDSGNFSLAPGNYSFTANAHTRSAQLGPNPVPGAFVPDELSWEASLQFIDGQTQGSPFLPTLTGANGGWVFEDLPSGWYDPVMANGFEFEMLSGSYFTVAEMPVGLGDANGYTLTFMDGINSVSTELNPGDVYNFPAGVTSFKVLDIDPPFDPDNPLAFPIYLDFSTELATFSMTPIPVPEPSGFVLLAIGAALAITRWRRARS